MTLKLKRTPGLYLVGFMASGKTTIGSMLARELGWHFADLDDDIESQQGTKIALIFEKRGEDEFRRIEREALRGRVNMIERGKPTVVALGGGTFMQAGNFELVENNGVTVWLDCPLVLVRQRIGFPSHRPMAQNPGQLEELYERRRQAYSRADFRIEISGDNPAPAVASILALPIF